MSGSTRVMLYTRPLCLLCHRVADLLRQACVLFKQIEVTGRLEQERIAASCNAPSFPIVLVDGCYVGGYAHILQLHATGRLAQLAAASAAASSDTAAAAASLPSARSQASGSYAAPPRSRVSNMSILYESLKKDPGKGDP